MVGKGNVTGTRMIATNIVNLPKLQDISDIVHVT